MRSLFLFWLVALTPICLRAQDAATSPAPSPSDPPTAAASPVATPGGAVKLGTYSECHVDGPYIAMTFDDGPNAASTPRLLDMLEKRHLKATFFMIGANAQANPAIVKRILADGDEIGNHSWTHPQFSKLSKERVTEEITKTQDAIQKACGYTPTLLRPPYGAITKDQKAWINKQFGLSIVLWSVDTNDWRRPGSAVITQRVLKGAQPGAIILQHDIHKQTVDAMPAALDGLIAKGYKLVTVSELIAMNHPVPPKPAATKPSEKKKNPASPAKKAALTNAR